MRYLGWMAMQANSALCQVSAVAWKQWLRWMFELSGNIIFSNPVASTLKQNIHTKNNWHGSLGGDACVGAKNKDERRLARISKVARAVQAITLVWYTWWWILEKLGPFWKPVSFWKSWGISTQNTYRLGFSLLFFTMEARSLVGNWLGTRHRSFGLSARLYSFEPLHVV